MACARIAGSRLRDRAPLVALVLEDVGVDRPDAHAVLAGQRHDGRVEAVGEIPQHVHGHGRGGAGVGGAPGRRRASLSCQVDGRGRLVELAEPRAGVGEAPGLGVSTLN